MWTERRLVERGVMHGLTTRGLGDMKDAARRDAAFEALGISRRPLYLLRQAHGVSIHKAEEGGRGRLPLEGDGWISSERGLIAAVFVADCMPLFLWDKKGSVVGVFHSGWRGTRAGMPRRAVGAFQELYGVKAESLRAAIGPHIRRCCYRVGPEVAKEFPRAVERRGEDLYLDMAGEAKAQFLEAGMEEGEIFQSELCTCCQEELFFSYRRQKKDSRMLAFFTLS